MLVHERRKEKKRGSVEISFQTVYTQSKGQTNKHQLGIYLEIIFLTFFTPQKWQYSAFKLVAKICIMGPTIT